MNLEHIQDSCNKSTAIYSIKPDRARSYANQATDPDWCSDLIFSIYERWFRDHQVDIDFGNFIAKHIRVEIPSDEHRPAAEDIIHIHKAWCEHLEDNLHLCSTKRNKTGKEIDDPPREYIVGYRPNRKQNMYYKIKPLFRALIMIVDQHASLEDAEKIVRLFRTNIPAKLSTPITFETISPKLDSDKSLGDYSIDDSVTNTLSAAIDFITALESREKDAFPEDQRDPSVIDENGGDPGVTTRRARAEGYTGPDICRSSSSWVKLAEGEYTMPPITLEVMHMFMRPPRVIAMATVARYKPSEQRTKYGLFSLAKVREPW